MWPLEEERREEGAKISVKFVARYSRFVLNMKHVRKASEIEFSSAIFHIPYPF